jgi:hypothetical protein
MTSTRYLVRLALIAALSPVAACGGLFDVEAPGRIADEDLNDPDAAAGIVTGISYDLAQALDGIIEPMTTAAGELWHGGSYNWADIPRGIILPEDVDGVWGTMMQARWVAEHGIERMQSNLDAADFARSPLVARAYTLGGFANRLIGEHVCETVIDGGAPEPHTVEFDRGIEKFTRAIEIGTAAGATAADEVTAAYAGRATLRAWKGDWAGAEADAAKVPTNFVYLAYLQSDAEGNDLAYETHDRFEYTVWGTEFADHYGDPRAPWDTVYRADGSIARGANGSTFHFQQQKYDDMSDDIPLAKGTEMLVLRAEARLRANDIAGAYQLMNQARTFYQMNPLPVASSLADAWRDLHYERGATVWLENRRLWDLRRWFAETGPAHHDFLNGRDKCVPISKEERDSNPNIS